MVSKEDLNKLKKVNKNLKNLFHIERTDKRVKSLNLSEYDTTFNSDDDIILSKKYKINDNQYLYSFKSMNDYNNERKIYLNKVGQNFNDELLKEKENLFGTITFVSNEDLSLEQIYDLYKTR
ncbi:hypothetical protein JIY74_24535 [Vibrio harveyi]|nr:hypothetical protein [Vibrio harveyi]